MQDVLTNNLLLLLINTFALVYDVSMSSQHAIAGLRVERVILHFSQSLLIQSATILVIDLQRTHSFGAILQCLIDIKRRARGGCLC